MSTQYTVATGSGLFGLALVVTAVLFVLKVAGVMHAAWWVVFVPLLAWLGVCVLGLLLFVFGIAMVLIFGVIIWMIEGRP